MAVDGLPNRHDQDLSWLKAGGRGAGTRLAAKMILWGTSLIFGLLLIIYLLHQIQGGEENGAALHKSLLELHEPWADELAIQVTEYRSWLDRHGTTTEREIFDDILGITIRGVLGTSESPNDSLLSTLYVSAHTGVLRLSFLIITSLRLWLVSLLIAFYLGYNSYRPYKGDDLLGQTGNGRLFYSGARGGLENLSSTGAPDVLVRGLACPEAATKVETHASSIWRVLKEWGATNTTNEALAAIIIKHGDTASYIPKLEDESLFEQTFKGDSLSEHVTHLLHVALELHSAYATGDYRTQITGARSPVGLSSVSSKEYSQAISYSLHQVLSPHHRQEVGALAVQEVATLVLALESGKVLAHSLEGGRWFRRSNFPHLSARAVLHSVTAYPVEYDFYARERIRQALVYASRTSSFAPVRMPLGMQEDVWALRQWAEILLASPHELVDVVDEVEMVGLVRSAHQKWISEVLPKAITVIPELTTTSFVTHSDLLFLPLTSIVALLRRTVDSDALARLSHLSGVIGARQKRRIEAAQQSEDGVAGALIYDRVFAPIPEPEVLTLSSLHTVSQTDLREWSALRNILASFGWLARRVGDYTVPESSVIFSVFKTPVGYPGANALNLIGKVGLVPLRGAKFREPWGVDWDQRFQSFPKATMSESREDFEKVLKGIKDEVEDESSAVIAPASV